ncbi:DUF5004 domain-containing protein [Pontibacter anaerobius]|uniref:DUF5004 domain-containing protein n=1 Tax=Pontibacter anaerobius TaxID=2993940 RepID=A0ABT3RCI8_9BACT|nr:DUF5004 domain-containing protein [Pontibacter anaerobius]MCX2739123.1 DUF5004 domain-containing protein [Pontibacter anaerobius]
MRTKNYILYLILFLSVNFLVSCDDDDDDKDPEPSKTELITSGEWKGDKVLLNNIDVAAIPNIGENATTFQTLRLTFKEDKTYTAIFQAQGDEQSFGGNWEFNADETKVTLDTLGELDIKTLTQDNLDLTTIISTDNINLIGEILGIDPKLIAVFTGGNPVEAEMRFVK